MSKTMYADFLITVLASAVIGWNLGSWLIPGAWLSVLCLVAVVRYLPIGTAIFGQASRDQERARGA
jgi:hypothetical protein